MERVISALIIARREIRWKKEVGKDSKRKEERLLVLKRRRKRATEKFFKTFAFSGTPSGRDTGEVNRTAKLCKSLLKKRPMARSCSISECVVICADDDRAL